MKILLLHNFYRSASPSGENQVFELEHDLLQKHGHDVRRFTRHSDELEAQGVLGKIKGAASVPWNPFSARALKKVIKEFQPDVVHAHNTVPMISPSIFSAAKGTARIQRLPNYRFFCAGGFPMRNGQVCTECLDQRSPLPAMRYGCYRDSRIATAPLAAGIAFHRLRGTWQRDVEAFIVLTEFQKEKMVAAGLSEGRVYVKPNFYPGNPSVVAWNARPQRAVFVGRVSAEKGVKTLLRAWAQWGREAPSLRIVGDGEQRNEMESLARSQGLPVEFLGQLTPEKAQAEIGQARLVVLPSEWFEGFPMVLREAFALGTPSAVSNIGPLPGLVQNPESGCIFEPSNPESLLNAVRNAWEDPERLERWSRGARAAFEAKYTEDANYEMLMAIYEQAMERSERARHAGSLRSA